MHSGLLIFSLEPMISDKVKDAAKTLTLFVARSCFDMDNSYASCALVSDQIFLIAGKHKTKYGMFSYSIRCQFKRLTCRIKTVAEFWGFTLLITNPNRSYSTHSSWIEQYIFICVDGCRVSPPEGTNLTRTVDFVVLLQCKLWGKLKNSSFFSKAENPDRSCDVLFDGIDSWNN